MKGRLTKKDFPTIQVTVKGSVNGKKVDGSVVIDLSDRGVCMLVGICVLGTTILAIGTLYGIGQFVKVTVNWFDRTPRSYMEYKERLHG